jgi:uncharacterized damage-inducible protein DinB
MKQLLQQYAAYNLWASKRILERILLLNDDSLNKEVGGSFSSIFKLILHMWDAESMWWQRLKLVEHVARPSDTFNGNIAELAIKLTRQSTEWELWVNGASEVALNHVFAYRTTKREEYKQPVYEVLMHLFNHQSYHRGQLVMKLRLLGEEKIPATDFVVFARKK